MYIAALIVSVLSATQLHAGPVGFAGALGAERVPPGVVSPEVVVWPGGMGMMEVLLDTDDTPLDNARLEVEPPHKSLPAPLVLQLSPGSDVVRPLPEVWSLQPRARRAFLLRYAVPASAKPGRHAHTLRVRSNELSRSLELSLTLEVLELPATLIAPMSAMASVVWPPELPGVAEPAARAALFSAWAGVPAALWPQPAPGASLRPDDVTPFLNAQSWLQSLAPVLLPPLLGVETATPRGFAEQLEAARLGRWPEWARELTWSSGVQVEVPIGGGADAVEKTRALLERYRQEFPAVGLLLAGPFLSQLQGHSDAWSLPLSGAKRIAEALATGVSGAEVQASPLTLRSGTDGMPFDEWPALQAVAAYALDGCSSTYWSTMPGLPAVLELDNPGRVRIEQLTIIGDAAPKTVITSFANQPPSESSITWREVEAGHWSGSLKYPAPFEFLRLEFSSAPKRGHRIREVLVNTSTPMTEESMHARVLPWVSLSSRLSAASLPSELFSAESAGALGIRLGALTLEPVPEEGGAELPLNFTEETRSAKSVGGKRKSGKGGDDAPRASPRWAPCDLPGDFRMPRCFAPRAFTAAWTPRKKRSFDGPCWTYNLQRSRPSSVCIGWQRWKRHAGICWILWPARRSNSFHIGCMPRFAG